MSHVFLKKLHNEIWTLGAPDRFGFRRPFETAGRFLSEGEWLDVKSAVAEHSLACLPGSGVFGFGLAISLYAPPAEAPYPGTEDAFHAEHLLTVTNAHLKLVLKDEANAFFWQNVIEPLAYTPENEKRVAAAKLGKLGTRADYEY